MSSLILGPEEPEDPTLDIELEEEEEKYRSGIEKINEMIQRVWLANLNLDRSDRSVKQ